VPSSWSWSGGNDPARCCHVGDAAQQDFTKMGFTKEAKLMLLFLPKGDGALIRRIVVQSLDSPFA
jgi:hypothetical protein